MFDWFGLVVGFGVGGGFGAACCLFIGVDVGFIIIRFGCGGVFAAVLGGKKVLFAATHATTVLLI